MPKKKGSSDKIYSKELLKISTTLLNNITSKDLLRTIYDTIKPIFPFDNAGLFLIDHELDIFWEILEEGILPQNDLQDSLAINNLLGPFAYTGNHPDTFFYADTPIIFSVEAQSKIYQNPQWELMKAHGLKEMIAGPLMVNNKKIGFFCFNSKEEGFYREKDFELFETIGNQLAVAVSNIMTNEQLLEEKRFKETLLGISKAVATIQDRKQLFKIIFETVNKVIPVDDVGFLVLDEAGTRVKDLAVNDNYHNVESNEILFEKGLGDFLDVDAFVNLALTETGIITIEEAITKFPENPIFPTLKKSSKIKEMLFTPMKVGDKSIGVLIVDSFLENTYSEEMFSLFKAIADQLAVAVNNVLANEELLTRQKRIQDLLKISTAATKIKNRSELLKVIFETIKPIFPFDTAGIFIIDFENDLHYDLLDAVEILGSNDSIQVELIEKKLLGSFKHNGSGIDYVTRTGEPVVFNIKKDGKKWPHPQLEVMYDAGLRELLCVPLKSANETFGMFCVNSRTENFFNEGDFGFFKTISEQVGLAVKNIVANEEVLLQKQRLENLLNVSTAATKIKNRSELLKVVFETIKPIFPFDSAGLFIIDREQNEHYEILDDIAILGDEDISQKELITSNLLGRFRHKDSAVDFLSSGDHPRLFTIKKDGKKWPHPQFEIMYSTGLRQIIGIGLRSGKETFGMLCFNTKQEDFFSEKDFPFFQAISEQVALAVRNMLAKEQIVKLNHELQLERDYLIEEVKIEHNFEEIIGNSPLLREVFKSVEMVSHTDATVLVEGETGTGKELIARAIHNRSDRKKKPMVKVNCATLPKELIESELFGHEKGSFTGAFERRIGKFELANKSTLFLDEVGEMPLELQAKLLRAIQEKEIERVGGKETIKVDVRIIAATNRNLLEESEKGGFRSDLYYRLNVFPIRMPALRERIEDIPLLATFFAQKYCGKFNTNFKGIKEKAMQELLEYHWPGNIRELENLVEQACILNQGKALSWARELVSAKPKRRVLKEKQDYGNFDIKAIKKEQENKERETILEALKKTNWRIRGDKGAAKLLGIKPTTLEYRMTKLGLK